MRGRGENAPWTATCRCTPDAASDTPKSPLCAARPDPRTSSCFPRVSGRLLFQGTMTGTRRHWEREVPERPERAGQPRAGGARAALSAACRLRAGPKAASLPIERPTQKGQAACPGRGLGSLQPVLLCHSFSETQLLSPAGFHCHGRVKASPRFCSQCCGTAALTGGVRPAPRAPREWGFPNATSPCHIEGSAGHRSRDVRSSINAQLACASDVPSLEHEPRELKLKPRKRRRPLGKGGLAPTGPV